MKTLLVCQSYHHGNTRKVAEAMAEVLDGRVVPPGQVTPKLLEEFDAVGFGSGIYMGRVHRDITDLVERLPDMGGKRAFLFVTSGSESDEYTKPALEQMAAKGFKPLGLFECTGRDTYRYPGTDFGAGHPNEEDLEHAREFALGVRRRLETETQQA